LQKIQLARPALSRKPRRRSDGNKNDIKASQWLLPDTKEQGSSTHFNQSNPFVCGVSSYELEAQESPRQPSMAQFRDLKPDVLLGSNWTCISPRRFGGRCQTRIPQERLQLAVREIMRLQTSISRSAPTEAELVKLAGLLLCKKYHQQSEALKIAKAWGEELSVSSSLKPFALSSDKDIGENVTVVAMDTRTINRGDEFKRPARVFSNKRLIQSMVSKMRGPLRSLSEATGIIYMYTRPGTPSMIKIGYTMSSDLQPRLNAIAAKCHFEPQLIYQRSVLRAMIVEFLIFSILLKQRRLEFQCNAGQGCQRWHREWFEIDKELAILTVKRWAEWMDLDPYMSNRLDPFWDVVLCETTLLKTLDAFHQWIELMTQECVQRGESSWRGRTDGRFQSCNESIGDETQSPPISPLSSVFSTDAQSVGSATAHTSILSNEQSTSAVKEFVTLLLQDEDLQRLQVIALTRTEPEKFERNLFRLLRIYSTELQTVAATESEFQAVRFIKTKARDVASCFRSQVDPARRDIFERLNRMSKEQADKKELLQRYLKDLSRPETDTSDLGLGNFESLDSRQPGGIVRYKTVSDDVLDDIEIDEIELDDIELDDIELDGADSLNFHDFGRVKEFMVTSEAFGKLRDNLTAFVFPPDQLLLKGLLETDTEKLTNLSSEGSTNSFEPEHTDLDVSNLSSDLVREQIRAAVYQPRWLIFRYCIRKLSQTLISCCLRTAEDLGMYTRPLCKGFIRLKWACVSFCSQPTKNTKVSLDVWPLLFTGPS
jgi:hypothetical protein